MNDIEDDECFYGGETTNTDLELQTVETEGEEMEEARMIGNALVRWVLNE